MDRRVGPYKVDNRPRNHLPRVRRRSDTVKEDPLDMFIRVHRRYAKVIIRLRSEKLFDDHRHECFRTAKTLIESMMRLSLNCLKQIETIPRQSRTKEMIITYLKTLNKTKLGQIDYLLYFSESEGIYMYQELVDILEFTSPKYRRLFNRWRQQKYVKPRFNRIPIPYN